MEIKYKDLLEQSSALMVVVDTSFTIVTASDAYLKVTLTKREEIVGRNLFELFPDNPNELDANGVNRVKSSIERAIKHKKPDTLSVVKYDIPIPNSEGGGFLQKYWMPIHTPVFDDSKKVKYVIQHVVDVTEKEELTLLYAEEKKALKRIEESNQRYYRMLMHSPFAFCIMKGAELKITLANDLMKDFWGKGKDVEGKTLLELLPELKNQEFPGLIKKVLSTGAPVYLNEIYTRLVQNGKMQERYYNLVYQPFYEADETITGVTTIAYDVTDTVLNRKEAEDRERRFRLLIMQAPVAICILRGEDYLVETINADMLLLWDRTEENVLNRVLSKVIPALLDLEFMKPLENVYTTGKGFVTEELKTSLKRFGKIEEAYVKYVYEPVREPDGTVSGVMVLAHNITDQVIARKGIESQALREQELLMTAPGFICTLKGPDHIYELVNEQYQKLFGTRHIKGKPIIEALPELKGQGFDKILDNVYNTGETFVGFDIPITLARNEGEIPEERFFNFSYQPMYDENKKIYSILVFGYEVTEQVLAKKKIEQSELYFRQIADTMPAKISHVDLQGNFIYFNKNWLEYTGRSVEELKDMGYLDVIHPDEVEKYKSDFHLATKNHTPLSMELRLLNKNGEYKWHLNLATPVKDDGGNIKMWIGSTTEIHQQITSKEKLEKAVSLRTSQLEEKNEELEGANKELTTFNYISSHDLQEPLRKIQTFVALILAKEKDNLSDQGKSYFKRMREIANQMQNLIEDLLTYSRTKNTNLKFEPTDLRLIIDQVKDNFTETIIEKGATLQYQNLCTLDIIPFQFRQLFGNLLSNSLKFSKPDRPPYITIITQTETGSAIQIDDLFPEITYCHIQYTDNGIGFDPQYQERIFEVFQRLQNKDEYLGTGIGLAICKRIVENHQGVIIATGEPNKGARFDIYIPLVRKDKSETN